MKVMGKGISGEGNGMNHVTEKENRAYFRSSKLINMAKAVVSFDEMLKVNLGWPEYNGLKIQAKTLTFYVVCHREPLK